MEKKIQEIRNDKLEKNAKMLVAIVGCGSIAKVHAKILNQMSKVKLVAFVDCIIERAKEFNNEFGDLSSKCFESIEELFSQRKVDVIHICTPHYLHVPMAIEALLQGVNVFMEKPPAISKDEFLILKNMVEQGRTHLGFCFQNRFNDSTKAVETLLHSSEAGKIIGGRGFVTWDRNLEYYIESDWRGRKSKEGGGCLINQAIHTLDLLNRFMGGQPIKIQARMANFHLSKKIEVEDTLNALIEYKDKRKACFYATTAYVTNSPILIEIECENMTVRLEGSEVFCINREGERKKISFKQGDVLGKDYWGNGHNACILEYYHCLEESRTFSADIFGVEDIFLLTMDIYESAAYESIIDKSNTEGRNYNDNFKE